MDTPERDAAMQKHAIEQAVDLGRKLRHVFVATADSSGLPHMAAASSIAAVSDRKISIAEWFCPGTLENLDQNRRVAVVVWDAAADQGYQLLGEVEAVEDQAVMNGYAPEMKSRQPMPQVEWRLVFRVDKVLDFTHAPHSDVEE